MEIKNQTQHFTIFATMTKFLPKTTLLLLNLLVLTTLAQSPKLYFTQPIDNSIDNTVDTKWSQNLEDSIVDYILSAQTSIDVCVFNNTRTDIAAALNNRYNAGVEIRYIYNDKPFLPDNSALATLNSSVPTIARNESSEMHNKFMVIDHQKVWCGSTNWTASNLEDDFNHMWFIEDSALANAFTTEFNEMWGSSTQTPGTPLFGPAKSDNTTHSFTINGSPWQLYFSPSDQVQSKILQEFTGIENEMQFGMLFFTQTALSDPIVAKANSGIPIKGIIEETSLTGMFVYNDLDASDAEVVSHENITSIYHHKFATIDATFSASEPTVICGSYNFTSGAESENDEFAFIIQNQAYARLFREALLSDYNNIITSTALVNQNSLASNLILSTVYLNPLGQKIQKPTIDYRGIYYEIKKYQSGKVISSKFVQ